MSLTVIMECDVNTDNCQNIARVHCSWSTLQECLRTHKVFTKDQCFYLNYHKFSIKSFYGELLKIIHFYHFDSDPRFPPFLLYV